MTKKSQTCRYIDLLVANGPMTTSAIAKHFGQRSDPVSRAMRSHLAYKRYGLMRSGFDKVGAVKSSVWSIDHDKYQTYIEQRWEKNIERLNAMRQLSVAVTTRRLNLAANDYGFKTQWLPGSPYFKGGVQ